jgi:hypothetical protein
MHTRIIVVVIVALIATRSTAQPFTLNKSIVPKQLMLKDFKPKGKEQLNGKINVSRVTQTADTAYYFIKGLSIYQVVYFNFSSSVANDDSKVFLCKNNWKRADKTSALKQGKWDATFRTEGSFGIMVVQSKRRNPYYLSTWVCDEPKVIKMPMPF